MTSLMFSKYAPNLDKICSQICSITKCHMKLTYLVQIHLVRRDAQLTKGGSLKLYLNEPKPAKS